MKVVVPFVLIFAGLAGLIALGVAQGGVPELQVEQDLRAFAPRTRPALDPAAGTGFRCPGPWQPRRNRQSWPGPAWPLPSRQYAPPAPQRRGGPLQDCTIADLFRSTVGSAGRR